MNKEQVIDDLVNTLKNNKIEPIQSDVHSHQNIYSQTKRVRVFYRQAEKLIGSH